MRMTDRRSDVLYAKIRRGGMGTGMPNFGTLFTTEETWALVDYLRTFSSADAGANELGLQVEPAP
jgi:mono/diheme cytochrome c family protein